MEPMTIAMLVGAGLGALRSNEEKNMWADQQRAEAEKTRYAPWTGQWGSNLAPPTGDMGNIMAGTMAGAAIGQQMDRNADTTLTDGDQPENIYTRHKKYSLFGSNESESPSYKLMNEDMTSKGSYRLFENDRAMFGNDGNPYADEQRYRMMLGNY